MKKMCAFTSPSFDCHYLLDHLKNKMPGSTLGKIVCCSFLSACISLVAKGPRTLLEVRDSPCRAGSTKPVVPDAFYLGLDPLPLPLILTVGLITDLVVS